MNVKGERAEYREREEMERYTEKDRGKERKEKKRKMSTLPLIEAAVFVALKRNSCGSL